jgi:hypothetical protein
MKINLLKVDKMRYQTNKIASSLVFLSLVLSIVALFTLITYDNFGIDGPLIRIIPDHRIGIEIGIGIVCMLSTFLAAEKLKYYDRTWSFIGVFVLSGINIARIFHLPLYTFAQGWIPVSIQIQTILEFALSAALLIAAGVISTIKVILLQKYSKGAL